MCQRDEVGELTNQLRQQVASATAGSIELVEVQDGLESYNANADHLYYAKGCAKRRIPL